MTKGIIQRKENDICKKIHIIALEGKKGGKVSVLQIFFFPSRVFSSNSPLGFVMLISMALEGTRYNDRNWNLSSKYTT